MALGGYMVILGFQAPLSDRQQAQRPSGCRSLVLSGSRSRVPLLLTG